MSEQVSVTDIVEDMAAYTRRSGFKVDYNGVLSWVAIHDTIEDDDAFFFDEGEADEFIEQAGNLAEEADVPLSVAMEAHAKQYIDCL